jgi:diacylglycerol kinase (ATP)
LNRRILIFHNPFAAKGKSNAGLQKITAVLQQNGFEYKIFNTLKSFDENRLGLTTITKEFDATEIWLSGGDGTLHLLVNSLPQQLWHLPVGIIPTGTGNDFIKNYITTPTFNNCLDIAVAGTLRPVDVWQCNNRLFVHGIGIGFDGQVVESMLQNRTPFSGFLAYYYHVLRLLLTYREKPFVLTANGQTTNFDGFMVTIGNGHTFGGGFKITPKALINDGLLDVCVISAVPMLKRPLYLTSVEKGKHLHLKYVNYFTTDKLILKTPVTMPGHIDGELFYSDTFDIAPHTQKLLVLS